MPNMRLEPIEPLPQLRGYIEKLWILEIDGPMPASDMSLIVPNGLIKMVIPFRNGLSGRMEGCAHVSKEHSITLIGLADIPSVVTAETLGASGTIGVEFSALGAYRFFHLRHAEIRNKIHTLTDVLGPEAREFQDKMGHARHNAERISLLQQFLYRQLLRRNNDSILDHCVKRIGQTRGRVTVRTLEKETGYSSRWLNMKFTEHVGVSPKNLASIMRFMQFYEAWAKGAEKDFFRKEFYEFYYDQSHFIKDFKRFTGMPPTRFAMSENEFGRVFYKN